MRFVIAVILAGAAWLANSSSLLAQNYPSRPITVVVPFAAGGGTDRVARVVAEELTKALNTSVVVENKPGGNGIVAVMSVARAAPDGYTLLMTTNTTHSVNPALMKSLPYHPIKDFEPVAQMGNHPFMLIVREDLPAKSVAELIDYSRKNPGTLSYGYGNGTGLVASETLKRLTNSNIVKIPYRGTPQAITDMLGGRLDMMFIDVTAGIGQVKSGRLRVLGVANKEGTPALPGVPAVAASVPDFDLLAWNGVFAPAGTPPEVIARLNTELRKILEQLGAKEKFSDMGLDVRTGTPQELASLVQTELDRWAGLVSAAGIEQE